MTSPNEQIGGEDLYGQAEPEMPPASEADAVALEPIDGADAEQLAGELHANAAAMEPYVSRAVRAAVSPLGGHLQGFDARLKTSESIARKITTDLGANLPTLPATVTATGIKDSLRYTAIFRPGEYVDRMTKSLDALRAAGIEAERVTPYWERGQFYAGTNVVMRAPNGFRFELQFHTPRSFVTKEHVNHDKYEAWRLLDRRSPEAQALYSEMAANAAEVPRPPGIEGWRYRGAVQADVGVTPFREGVDDPVGFYDSEKFARFERDARDLADRYGVTIDEEQRATGVWEGSEEPSVHFRAHDGEAGVRAFAAELGRAYRQDGVALFEPGISDDGVIARFKLAGGESAPIREAQGKTLQEIVTNMGAHELDVSPEFRPDLFKEPIKLKGGGFATPRTDVPAPRVKTRNDKSTYGLPPRIEDTVPGPGRFGMDKIVEGSERPPEYLYRAISEDDYQQALGRGYLQSDQRMNLADEGTVADFTDPSFYLPGKLASDADGVYPARIVRIKYRDEDGWTLDHDGYAKTHEQIPMSQIDLVSPKIETVRTTDPRDFPIFDTRIVRAPAGQASLAPDRVYEAMAKAGLPAGRFLPGGALEVIGQGPAFVKQLEALSGDLGVGYDGYLGKFDILERDSGDYEGAIGNFQRAQAGQARAPGGLAAGDAGRAALGEGARGAEEVARPLEQKVIKPPADVSPPAPPTQFTPPYPPSEAARFGADRLWGAHAAIGQAENAARAELPALGDDRLLPLLWEKGEGRGLGRGTIRLKDVAGDQQSHTYFSDGHGSVREMAEEARLRGEQHIVISDHAHALTSEDIAKQHEEIDRLNQGYREKNLNFKILKGIEANVLADGSLDVAPEVLAQFDVVNAAIHGPIEARAGQLVLFKEANTERLLRAMDDPEVNVLVHPHSVAADWDAIAQKAAQKGIALEVNGRDMLRNETQEAAADMIAAAKRHGAKLVLGSDAHTPDDLVDLVYAVRFAAKHGVTRDDLSPLALAPRGPVDASASIPETFDTSQAGLASHELGGGMNEVWKVATADGREFVVKPEPDPQRLEAQGIGTYNPLRENIEPGSDIERERATYLVSQFFNDVGGTDFSVRVPAYRIGQFTRDAPAFEADPLYGDMVEAGTRERTDKAGIAEFVEGEEGRNVGDWQSLVGDGDLRSASMFDALVGNTDRHAGNFLFGEEENGQNPLWLIDHGLTFPVGPSNGFANENLVDLAATRFKSKASTATTGQLSRAQVSFLERLRDRLRRDLPGSELTKLLSPETLDEMMKRLDLMIEHSSLYPDQLLEAEGY